MLSQILSGRVSNYGLLFGGILLFLYLLPAILAFVKAQRRFYILGALNILLGAIQGGILVQIAPQLIIADTLAHAARTVLLVDFGPGWLLLLAWTFVPAMPDPRLVAARASKTFDVIAALPLIAWFGYGILQVRPSVARDINLIAGGQGSVFVWAQLFALTAAAAFDVLLIWMLLVRDKARAKAHGVLPRLFGFAGTFLGVGILQLPVATLSPAMQIVAALITGIGSLGSFVVLWWLGKSFSIMPEARNLVTGGPYAWARHPLYTMEMISVIGAAMQFAQPTASVIALGVAVLLAIRSVYEERVLTAAYPEYDAYRARTARFIPGLV